MEVTIGVQNDARVLSVDTDDSAEEVAAAVEAAMTDGGVLRLVDTKGRTVLVPGRAVGWIQVGESEKGKVGFGAV